MMPIAENGATTHIIAARNEDETLTTDIDVVLYEKTATGWSGTAYHPSVTKEDAMIDIANEFGLSDPFGGEWLIDLDEIDVLDHVIPRVPFGKGFFVTDPLHDIANQIDDPEPLAEAAESNGLAAGSGVVNTGSLSGSSAGTGIGGGVPTDCSCEACIQSTVAIVADLSLADASISDEQLADALRGLPGFSCPCCFSFTRRSTPSAWSNWACGAWGSPSPDPITGRCNFSTTSSRFQTRTITRYCFSCVSGSSTRTTTQFRTRSGALELVLLPDANGNCVAPAGCGAPNDTITTTGWAPPAPACPCP